MSICCLLLLLCLQNKMYIILYTFSTFNMFSLLDTQFLLSHQNILVIILGFEVTFSQLTDKLRTNEKLREYLPSVKLINIPLIFIHEMG